MAQVPFSYIVAKMVGYARNTIAQISAINKKYAEPHIKTTLVVRVALLMLRIYLLSLVGVLIFKFVSMLR